MAKSYFATHIPVSNTQLPFKLHTFLYITIIVVHSSILTFTSAISITPTATENYLPSDDPNVTNLMVSHYDCKKQHILRRCNFLNIKQCTEAPSIIKHANVKKLESMLEQKLNVLKLLNVSPLTNSKDIFALKARIICFQRIDVLIELQGIITLCDSLLHLILSNVKTLLDILMVQIKNIKQLTIQ